MTTGITLCLMVKDEERYVESCIKSVYNIVDHIVVVDTGSTDSTMEICRRYTNNVYEIPFNDDFSSIRNATIDFATTPWILFLDADEEFEPQEAQKLVELVKTAPADVYAYKVLRYNFFSTGGWYSGRNVKLIRNEPSVRFRKRVNESVEMSIQDIGKRVESAPIVLNHYGHCRSVQERDEKSLRYIDLMEEQLKATPNDAIVEGYIGLISRTLGRFDIALERTEKALLMNPNSSTLHSFRGHVLRSVNRNEEAHLSYRKAVEIRPSDAAAWNMIGVTQLTAGNFSEAIHSFDKAILLEPVAIHTKINKGLAYQAMGEYEQAVMCFVDVIEKNRGFLRENWLGKVECDPYRAFYYETIMQFSGLGYHLSYCQMKIEEPKVLLY